MRFTLVVLSMTLMFARASGQVWTGFVIADPRVGAATLFGAPDTLALKVGNLGVNEVARIVRQEGEWSLLELRGIQAWASTKILLPAPDPAATPAHAAESDMRRLTDGMVAGSIAANKAPTFLPFLGGLVGGVWLPFIGNGIAYIATPPAKVPAVELANAQKYG